MLTMQGGNIEAKTKIVEQEKFITMKEALACLRHEHVHPKLQSYYLDFLISAFVTNSLEGSGTDIENIWRTYVS